MTSHIHAMATPPVKHRHAKQTRFLAALAQGRPAREAAILAGVPLATFYTWRRKHTRFRDAWNRAAAFALTPPFPTPAQLAAIDLRGPRTRWLWIPGGSPEAEPAWSPGDRVVTVVRSFLRSPDTLIFSTVNGDGRTLTEVGRATSRDPLPAGFDLPAEPLPCDLAARLPPAACCE